MNLFNQGQKISIFFRKDANLVEMSCTLEELHDDRLVLNLPQYFMRYIEHLQVGCEIMAKAFSKFGTIDFNSIVISSPLEDEFSIELDYNSLKLTKNEEIPVINSIENIDIKTSNGSFKLKTFEISTEYVKFYSEQKFSIDDILECTINLPKDCGIINFKAAVSEIDAVYENEYTATIETMTEPDRQTLLYYMYMYSNDAD